MRTRRSSSSEALRRIRTTTDAPANTQSATRLKKDTPPPTLGAVLLPHRQADPADLLKGRNLDIIHRVLQAARRKPTAALQLVESGGVSATCLRARREGVIFPAGCTGVRGRCIRDCLLVWQCTLSGAGAHELRLEEDRVSHVHNRPLEG